MKTDYTKLLKKITRIHMVRQHGYLFGIFCRELDKIRFYLKMFYVALYVNKTAV